jgi:putative sugar O-methyltransferase
MISYRANSFGKAIFGNPGIRSSIRRRTLNALGAFRRIIGYSKDKNEVELYLRMRRENEASSELYRAGRFWTAHNRRHADAIWGGGLLNLRNEYFNRTFSGPLPESRQVYRALLHMYFKYIRQFDDDGFLDRFEDPSIGGTDDQEILFGRAVSLDFLQSVEEAYLIRKSWKMAGKPGEPSIIVELGAGYGRLAFVMKKMLPDCSYIILDLPEALTCSQSWLSRVLPGEVVLYNETETNDRFDFEYIRNGKVSFLLPHQIESIESDSVSVFVNVYSFAEMPKQSIDNYFKQLDRITWGVLFTKQRNHEVNREDNVDITEECYPIPSHWKLLSHSKTTLYDAFFQSSYATRSC